jgi:hypothetical protein
MDALPPRSNDRFDLLRIIGELDAHSPTAGALLDRSLAAGVSLCIADDAAFDASDGVGVIGRYDPATKQVWIRRSVLEHDVAQAVQTLAHELVHAVDRTSGANDALVARLDARYRSEGWNDDAVRGAQVRYHSGLVRESRAYVVQAQVRRELGLEAKSSFHRAIAEAPTELGAYQSAWRQLATSYRADEPIEFRDAPVVFMPGSTPEDPA